MDRRSWLWRRKSSDKSPGETESSGSISSLSERFSDDQVLYQTQAAQSPEVTSKIAPHEEEISTPKKDKEDDDNDVKTLTDKLAAALLNISAKEDLVKQHAKVAEEAVSGWEKAENEVLSLKQQLDAARQKNSILEDRVSHLDGALKECMRQLRQARETQEQKIHEAVSSNSHDWESKRSELEGKVAELEAQLQTAKADAAVSIRYELHQRLEAVEKENLGLKLELQSRLEELEFRIVERDLSTQAAETASKQHLESVKKVAKLEAECRRLKAMTRKTPSVNDHRSLTASSVYVESFTDSMSDSGERLLAVESDMRKLGGWEMNECEPSRSDSCSSALVMELDQFKNEKATGKKHMVPSTEINLMDDFLEMEMLAALPDTGSGSQFVRGGVASDQSNVGHGIMEAEMKSMIQKNAELEKRLKKMEADKLEVEMHLTECQIELETSESRIRAAELKVAELQTQLALAKKSNQEAYVELKETKAKKEIVESKLKQTQTKVEELISKIRSLEEDIQKERALSAENLVKSRKLEDELSRMKHEVKKMDLVELKLKQTQTEAEELISKIGSLKEEIHKERALSAENLIKSRKLEDELSKMKHEAKETEIVESKLKQTQTKVEELISKICSLEEEIQKERALSAENLIKSRKLEDELSRMKHEAQVHTETLHKESINHNSKLKQEKELALAASRFAECQKTIASLGQQLKSLATLEDFLLDSDNPVESKCEVTQTPQNGGQQLKLHHNDMNLPKRDSESPISLKSSITHEKSRNSFGNSYGNIIPRSKSVSRRGSH